MRNGRAVIDALVTAGARLSPELGRRFRTDIKALVPIGGVTLIDRTIVALRGVASVSRITVVGPAEIRRCIDVDWFVEATESGEKNLLLGLEAVQGERTLLCASDMPFVTAGVLDDLLARAPGPAAVVYPIYTRPEFDAAYPGGRSAFARLADGEFTGGSAFVVRAATLRERATLLSKVFGARKNLFALATILGPALTFAFVRGAARVAQVEARASALLGGDVVALRGADPALALDCDDESDFTYAQSLCEQVAP
jgi:MobA-like NTP transferase protein